VPASSSVAPSASTAPPLAAPVHGTTNRRSRWLAAAGPTGDIDLALGLTLVELLLRPMGPWFVRAPLLLLALLGLVSVAWLRAPALWAALAVLVATRVLVEWPLPDNHIYLLAYWCLGIAIALTFPDPPRLLARTSRLLLGLVFAFALLWKAALSADYRDGRFFAVTLLTDDRFTETVQLVGGLSDAELAENREYLSPLPEGAELLDPPRLHTPRRFQVLVHVATWGTIAIEALAAILWLAPVTDRRLRVARHAVVLAFCLTTYAFAPVAGFGWLLIVMALATGAGRWLRVVYVAAFGLVLLYSEVPWTALALSALRTILND
jgi:hypothetical protein